MSGRRKNGRAAARERNLGKDGIVEMEKKVKGKGYWLLGLVLAMMTGCGLWLGIAAYGIAADDTYGGEALRDLQGVRWEKELCAPFARSFSARTG